MESLYRLERKALKDVKKGQWERMQMHLFTLSSAYKVSGGRRGYEWRGYEWYSEEVRM